MVKGQIGYSNFNISTERFRLITMDDVMGVLTILNAPQQYAEPYGEAAC